MLDVRRYMLVMWVSTLQAWFVWMWLRIIPVQQHAVFPHFISVPVDRDGQASVHQSFPNNNAISTRKLDFASDARQRDPVPYQRER